MNERHPSIQKESCKKKINKNYDPKYREDIIKKLCNAHQNNFDLALIASVAHTCHWDLIKAMEVLRILSGKNKSNTNNNSGNSSCSTKNKAKSLPGTLKSEKNKNKKDLKGNGSALHYSTNSLPSGQVWQRHYKSKPQSPGLLTMIPPHSKEISASKPSTITKSEPKYVDSDVKKAGITIQKIQQLVQNNIKIMVLMRGVPGSGKTHLAQTVVSLVTENNLGQHILSTDDYFIMLGRGNYAYDYNQLSQAHNWNQKRVSESLKRGINPIIVDNTNTQVWEMQPYVVMAIEHGYLVEVLEPVTEWRNKESELAKRNVHSVPREKIRQMMERYEPGWTGEKLLKLFGPKLKVGHESTCISQKVKCPINTLLAQHREHGAMNVPEKPKRKKNTSKKRECPQSSGVELPESKEKELEELNKIFAEYGKTLDPVSKQKVLESGVPISEVVARMRKLQGNILPLPKSEAINKQEKLSHFIKPVTSYSSLLRNLSEPNLVSSSNASETSECETDTDAEIPRWKGLKSFGVNTTNCFDIEEMQNEEASERKCERINPEKITKSFTPCDEDLASLIDYDINSTKSFLNQEKSSLLDFEAGTTPASLEDLSLLNYDASDVISNASSSSEEQETQMFSLQDSILENNMEMSNLRKDFIFVKKLESRDCQKNIMEDIPDGDELSQSLLNVLSEHFDSSENLSKPKTETETDAERDNISINESLLQMLVNKYTLEEDETLEMENENFDDKKNYENGPLKNVKSPDLEEVPLPRIPAQENLDVSQFKPKSISEKSAEKKNLVSKSNNFEEALYSASWDDKGSNPSPNLKTDNLLPKEQRSKGAVKKEKTIVRDKLPEDVIRSVDLSWSVVPFASSWDCNNKENNISESGIKNVPKPQRKFILKSDSSSNTQFADFDLWKKDEGVVKLEAHSRDINQNLKEQKTPLPQRSRVLMLDKSSMTLDAKDLCAMDNEKGIDILCGMFPNFAREHLIDILEKCKDDMLWAVEVLLETPQNLPEICTAPTRIENLTAPEQTKTPEETDCFPFQNVVISDGKKTIRRRKEKKSANSELSQLIKKQIESSIQINEDFYQDKTLMLKKMRHGEIQLDEEPLTALPFEEKFWEVTENENNENEEEEEEMISMKLDPEFLKKFTKEVGSSDDRAIDENMIDLFEPIINVPLSIAQQIYDYWVESVNKQLEDMQVSCDRLVLDEELLTKDFQDHDIESRQPDLREIMDMELAMLLYKQNQASMHENFRETMATKLSKRLLFEAYPNLDKKMLLDLFESEGRSLQKTIDVLNEQGDESPITVVAPEFLITHGKQLLEQVKSENPKKNLEKLKKPIIVVKPRLSKNKDASNSKSVLIVNPLDYRHKTAQLHQQRKECCRLAQEAFRKKSYSVASYFSHIASLYKDQIKEISKEPFPSTIFDDKGITEMKEIDFHFLLVSEALQVLDLFLDHHIRDLRKRTVSCTALNLITGRGQHSNKKKSKIKPAIEKRLEYRQLSFISVNPGMLRVTVHKNNLLSAEM